MPDDCAGDDAERIRQELLRERTARELTEAAQAVARVGSWVWDLVENTLTWSPELYRMHGLPPGNEPPHALAVRFIHSDDLDRVLAAVESAMATHETTSVDYRIVRADGAVRALHGRVGVEVDQRGRVTRVLGTATDLTERDTQRVLENARADFRRLVDHIPEGVIIDQGGMWVSVNPAFARALGHPVETLIGRTPFDFVHPDDAESVRARMTDIALGRDVSRPLERRLRRSDGLWITFEMTPTPLLDYGGSPSTLVLARDVTERRRLLAERMLSDRMVTVGTLAAGVAHEINNPLAYVMTNLDVIAEDMKSLARGDRAGMVDDLLLVVAEVREGAERIHRIVRDLGIFARSGRGPRAPVDPTRAMEAAIKMTFNEVRHSATLVKDYGDVPTVIADEPRLAQVFINLLVNAAQAIGEGAADRNEIRVSCRTGTDGFAILEVSDTGPGISAEVLPRLFDPFFSTKPVGGGQGLGLAICHGVVTALGGKIEVESEPGRGALFRVLLPPVTVEAPAEPVAPPATAPRERSVRVLVVDDDQMLSRAIRRVLRDHDVTCADSGIAARDLLAEGRTFDVVLCDLMMPRMSGMELYRELRDAGSPMIDRFVFLTGGAFTPSASQFLAEVPNQRLEKPVDRRRLLALVEQFSR